MKKHINIISKNSVFSRAKRPSTLAGLGLLIVAVLITTTAIGYIPKTRMILSRVLKNNGSSIYVVNQEVHFKTESDAIVVKETWTIENGRTLRLTARGGLTESDKWQYNVIYRDGRRFIFEEDDKVHNYPQSAEFVEPFFHFRKLDNLIARLIQVKILPQNILMPKQPVYSLKQLTYEPEPFARLSRTSGYIAYALGNATPPGADVALPGVWIEQDSFLLRKLRFKSQAELNANQYQRFARGLKLPKDRTLTWNNHSVFIRTLSAKVMRGGVATSSRFSPKNMEKLKSKLSSDRRAPAHPLIKEFYARFR